MVVVGELGDFNAFISYFSVSELFTMNMYYL